MTKQQMVDKLTQARDMLERCYIPWNTYDGLGGHCQLGCLRQVFWDGMWPDDAGLVRDCKEAVSLVDAAARRLHPGLVGRSAMRKDWPGSVDYFDGHAAVYVNNQLGKDAILAVYDDEIARLKVAILCEEESAKCQPEKELVGA